ncbi:MAG: response regulator [Blastopirellula sp.]|nr:MAG: response regulator [Blastopirellula sp.]
MDSSTVITSLKSIDILVVDDDAGDVLLTKKALNNSKMISNINSVGNGVEALAYLRQEREYEDAIRPDLILLDLNMPLKDGREVLTELKQDDNLRLIPVVILTTSDSNLDILKSYDLQASCFVTKPVDLEQFTRVVQSIQDFWFTIVKLPQNED